MSGRRREGIPGIVRVGGVRYRVVVEEEIIGEDGIEILGQHDYGRLQLRLSLAADPEVRPFVLFHELLHACITVSGGDCREEEGLVTGLAHVLLQVLRENPDLVRYLLGGAAMAKVGSPERADGCQCSGGKENGGCGESAYRLGD